MRFYMEVISNEFLRVEINLHGGSLHSIKFKEKELEYQIEKDSWPFQDVVIFPLPGKNIFKYKNTIYENDVRHGIARNSEFEVHEKKNNEITILTHSSKDSLKLYPFNFDLFLTYSLEKNKLSVKAKIINKNEGKMYASFGNHLGYIIDPSKAYISFKNENLKFLPLNEKGLISLKDERIFSLSERKLFLDKVLFKKYDTLVFKNNQKEFVLNSKNNNVQIKYSFDAPLFAVWSNSNTGNYVCIEPWWGISNYTDEIVDIENYEYINEIEKEKEFSYSYEFID